MLDWHLCVWDPPSLPTLLCAQKLKRPEQRKKPYNIHINLIFLLKKSYNNNNNLLSYNNDEKLKSSCMKGKIMGKSVQQLKRLIFQSPDTLLR